MNSGCIYISKDSIKDGDTVKICQLGSNSTVFRESNELTYSDPVIPLGTEINSFSTETTEADTQK